MTTSLETVFDVEALRLSLCLYLSLREIAHLQQTSRGFSLSINESGALLGKAAINAILSRSARRVSAVSPSLSLSQVCVLASRLTPWPSDFVIQPELLGDARYGIETATLSLSLPLPQPPSLPFSSSEERERERESSSSAKRLSLSLPHTLSHTQRVPRPLRCVLYRGRAQGRDRSVVANEHFPLCLSSAVSRSLSRSLSAVPFTKTHCDPRTGAVSPTLSFVAYFEATIHGESEQPFQQPHWPHAPLSPLSPHYPPHRSPCVAVGVARSGFSLSRLMPGWDAHSYALHGDDGLFYCGDGERGESLFPLSLSHCVRERETAGRETERETAGRETERDSHGRERETHRETHSETERETAGRERKRETCFSAGDTVGFGILYPYRLRADRTGENVSLSQSHSLSHRRRERQRESAIRGFWSHATSSHNATTQNNDEELSHTPHEVVSLPHTHAHTHTDEDAETERERDRGWFFFTKNGSLIAAREIDSPQFFKYSWFPVLGTDSYSPVSFNFGAERERPFAFDVVAWERERAELGECGAQCAREREKERGGAREGVKAEEQEQEREGEGEEEREREGEKARDTEPLAKRLRTRDERESERESEKQDKEQEEQEEHQQEEERKEELAEEDEIHRESESEEDERETEVSRFFRAVRRVRVFWSREAQRERESVAVPPPAQRYPWFEDVHAEWDDRARCHDKSVPDAERPHLFSNKSLSQVTRRQAWQERFDEENESESDSDSDDDDRGMPRDFLRRFAQYARSGGGSAAGGMDMARLQQLVSTAMPHLPLEEMQQFVQRNGEEMQQYLERQREEMQQFLQRQGETMQRMALGEEEDFEEEEYDESDAEDDDDIERLLRERVVFFLHGDDEDGEGVGEDEESEREGEGEGEGESGMGLNTHEDEDDDDDQDDEHFASMTFGKGIC